MDLESELPHSPAGSLDEAWGRLALVDPAAERRDELCGLDGPAAVRVDHLEELLQVHLSLKRGASSSQDALREPKETHRLESTLKNNQPKQDSNIGGLPLGFPLNQPEKAQHWGFSNQKKGMPP